MTGDNVLMHVDATVCWSIEDVQKCAERAAETMNHTGNKKEATGTIDKLRNDVLKQAEASLSALVGKVPCHAMPCDAMRCYAMPCHAMLYCAMPCYAMLCYGKVNFSNTFSAATALQVGHIIP